MKDVPFDPSREFKATLNFRGDGSVWMKGSKIDKARFTERTLAALYSSHRIDYLSTDEAVTIAEREKTEAETAQAEADAQAERERNAEAEAAAQREQEAAAARDALEAAKEKPAGTTTAPPPVVHPDPAITVREPGSPLPAAEIDAIVGGTVDELKTKIADLDVATLQRVRDAEAAKGEGDARTTALTAIDAAISKAQAGSGEPAAA